MPLDDYRSMRDFEKTAEPSGADPDDLEISEHERSGRPRFVVQEHHATALHWDFRLERDGVLVSWAVPKAPPPDPRVNHLAVHTEDHPLSYIDFAGDIAEGEYGGGRVHLWDRGTYEEHKWSDREVMVTLHGERLRGRYVLFRTGRRDRDWMMHRMDPPDDPERELLPDRPVPVEPVEGELPGGDGWRFLVVWPDSVRAAVAVDGGRCRAWSADGTQIDADFTVLRPFGRSMGARQAVLTGQLVRTSARDDSGTWMVEDVWFLDGRTVVDRNLSARRALLDGLGIAGDAWNTAPLYDDGALLLDAARAQGWPGVICIPEVAGPGAAPVFVPS